MQTTTFEHVVMSPDAYEALEKDAARYRWLRSDKQLGRAMVMLWVQGEGRYERRCEGYLDARIDAAIDAARKERT